MSSEKGGESFLTLCLQSRQGRKVIHMKSTSSTSDLYERASMEFGGASIQSLKGGGFPPKNIQNDDATIIISSLLSNQERLQVEFVTTAETTTTTESAGGIYSKGKVKKNAKKNGNNSTTAAAEAAESSTTSSTNSPARKSKRAASKAATESMPEMIKAQDELIKAQQAGNNGSRNKRSKPTTTNSGGSGGSPRKQQLPSNKAAKISASAGAGRRLADGAVVAGSRRKTSAGGGGRKRNNTNNKNNNASHQTTDLSEALLNSLNDKSQMGVILRKGMTNAVQASYETSKSFSRLAAIQAKNYEMTVTQTIACGTSPLSRENDPNNNTTVSDASSLTIKFQGSVDKSKMEETVDCIPQDVLTSVVEGIYSSGNKEALRPENLARLSPRVLWSCVYYFPNETSLDRIYPLLLPNLDWSFLRRRSTMLSEKARENQRQQEAALEENNETTMDMQSASNAVSAVEHAMEHHLHEYETQERKNRSAQAALARLQQRQNTHETTEWQLVTPTEPDRDELRECIESSLTAEEKFSSAANIDAWVLLLMNECSVHNWRELANVTDIAEVANKLQIPEKDVKAWIDFAQGESVGEIIVEICDGNVDAVELLSEKARSGTPKDLAAWRSIPDVLLEQLRSSDGEANANNHEWMDIVTLKKWCDRSHQVLGEVEWLNWYATPVE